MDTPPRVTSEMSSGCDPQEAEIAAVLEMLQNHRKLNEELSNKFQAKSDRIRRRLKIITSCSTVTSLQASAVRQRDAEIALLEKELQSERENDDLFNSVDARSQPTRDAEVAELEKELQSQREEKKTIAPERRGAPPARRRSHATKEGASVSASEERCDSLNRSLAQARARS